MITCEDLAKKIISRNPQSHISYQKFQMLAYYCFAWHYTLYEEQLFAGEFYAVAWGCESPQMRQVWEQLLADGILVSTDDPVVIRKEGV